jgi:hypothetical protein
MAGDDDYVNTRDAMLQARLEKTFDRLRSGELPNPPAVRTLMDSDKQTRCSGCGELIDVFERYYYARLRKVRSLRFHLLCHEAWIRFRRRAEAADQHYSRIDI